MEEGWRSADALIPDRVLDSRRSDAEDARGNQLRGQGVVNRRSFISCAICAVAGLTASEVASQAQGQSGFSRTILRKTEYPGDRYVTVLVAVDIEPNAEVARHTHPGVESGYLVSGSSVLSVKGQTDQRLKAGDGFQIPPEVPHSVRNGPEKSRVVATYVVEKDKPLASPAPE